MLESKRLLLIPVNIEIIDTLLVSDDLFYQKYGYKNDGGEYLNPSPDYLHNIKNRLLEHPEEYPVAVDYLIIVKDIMTVIGTIYFKYLPENGESEIGYGMSPQYEGNGYMSEALSVMLNFGRDNGVYTVIADTTIDNTKSQNVLKRNGFVQYKNENNMLYFKKHNMKLEVYKPRLEDLWFREAMLEDEETMSYNKAWGGTISFPRENWEEWFNHWVINHDNKRYYRYLKNDGGAFVGEIAYHYDSNYDGYMVNIIIHSKYRNKGYGILGLQILCQIAKENGITELLDDIAIDNPAITMFLKLGFVEQYRTDSIILLKKHL